jgi:hypothetical protein
MVTLCSQPCQSLSHFFILILGRHGVCPDQVRRVGMTGRWLGVVAGEWGQVGWSMMRLILRRSMPSSRAMARWLRLHGARPVPPVPPLVHQLDRVVRCAPHSVPVGAHGLPGWLSVWRVVRFG